MTCRMRLINIGFFRFSISTIPHLCIYAFVIVVFWVVIRVTFIKYYEKRHLFLFLFKFRDWQDLMLDYFSFHNWVAMKNDLEM